MLTVSTRENEFFIEVETHGRVLSKKVTFAFFTACVAAGVEKTEFKGKEKASGIIIPQSLEKEGV